MTPSPTTRSGILTVHASTLTRAVGTALTAAMLILTSGLTSTKPPAPTRKQRAQAGLAKARVTWGDKVVAFQTYKVQDKAAVSYQAGGKAAHTQSDAPYVDPGSFVVPVSTASTPAPAVKG